MKLIITILTVAVTLLSTITYGEEANQAKDNQTTNHQLLEEGLKLLHTEKVDDAIRIFTDIINLDQSMKAAYACRSDAYFIKGNWKKCLADLDILINKDPEISFLYSKRGLIHSYLENFKQSLRDFEKAIKLKTQDVNVLINRALTLYQMERYREAIADLSRVLYADEENLEALYNRANIWLPIREYTNAVADFRLFVQKDPENPSGYNALAWLLSTSPDPQIRDGKEAIKVATKACELTKWENAPCLDTLAAAYAEAGDFEKAVLYMRKTLKICPDDMKQEAEIRYTLFQAGIPFREF